MTQATFFLLTALPGIEPGIFAFKERDVASYTTGLSLDAEAGVEPASP